MPLARLSGLARYMFASIPARITTGGSAVATILLARTYGMDGKTAGAMAACLTAPHLFGPVYGRWLDGSADPRLIISGTCFLFAACFQLAILGFEWQMTWLSVLALLVCGTCSSFMMGGLSTQITKLVDDNINAQRKAQSWDTVTYGFGLTVGPMMTAILTEFYSTELSVSVVMGLPLLAGLFTLCLPPLTSSHACTAAPVPGFKQVIAVMRQSAPLKRTLVMTSGASFAVAALPVLAVYLSEYWQHTRESGAYLVTFYGVGCLCGAILLMIRPLRREALVLLRNVGAVLLLTLLLVALSQSFVAGLIAYWLCGVVNAIFFAVTLAARSEYAPKQGAAQIYMWVAAAKISFASMGAFVAGFLVDFSISLPLVASLCVLVVTLIGCFSARDATLAQISRQEHS